MSSDSSDTSVNTGYSDSSDCDSQDKHVIRTGQIKLDEDYYLFIMVEF